MTLSASDSVPLYSEGTFDEHIQELVNYLARPRVEEERVAYIRPFADALLPQEGKKPFDEDQERRKQVLDLVIERVNGVGEGSERDIEGFFNLLVAYVLDNYQDPAPQIETITKSIVSAPRPSSIKYRLLSNIFNATPRTSPLRRKIYSTLLNLASENEELEVLHLHKSEVDKWLEQWDIDVEEKATFLKQIADVLVKAGQPSKAYPYLILRAQILPKTSPNAEAALTEVIVDGLRLSSVFSFEPILSLPNITMVQGHCLFKLLRVFLGKGLAEYQSWLSEHGGELANYSLDQTALERKIKLVALTSLASSNVGKEVSYEEIAKTISVPEKEVENWVIQAIRAKLILGKLNQPAKTFVVIRSTTREFRQEDWEVLDKRLTTWKNAVLDVLQVVSAARKKTIATAAGANNANANTGGGSQNANAANAVAA
ncbi:PCI domain-containing protein [Serendipita vermifera]|nr:PCI domain-containing protein [Serendipita vermifera]